jgi:hypothetical protein
VRTSTGDGLSLSALSSPRLGDSGVAGDADTDSGLVLRKSKINFKIHICAVK